MNKPKICLKNDFELKRGRALRADLSETPRQLQVLTPWPPETVLHLYHALCNPDKLHGEFRRRPPCRSGSLARKKWPMGKTVQWSVRCDSATRRRLRVECRDLNRAVVSSAQQRRRFISARLSLRDGRRRNSYHLAFETAGGSCRQVSHHSMCPGLRSSAAINAMPRVHMTQFCGRFAESIDDRSWKGYRSEVVPTCVSLVAGYMEWLEEINF